MLVRTHGAGAAARSEVHRAREAGPLRLLYPRTRGTAAWVVTSSLGGGLVDGDHPTLRVTVDDGATALLTTQSSTKAYRGTASQRTDIDVGAHATALIWPDPLVPFRDAAFTQATYVTLHETASLALCDAFTAGRIAHGERWDATRIDVALHVTCNMHVLLHDRVVLDRAHGEVAARMNPFGAMGTVLLCGPRFAAHATRALASIDAQPLPRRPRSGPSSANAAFEGPVETLVAASKLVAPSASLRSGLGDGMLARIVGVDAAAVTRATRSLLREVCDDLDEDPWARKW